MYDGYKKYGSAEATGYDEARMRESLWWEEEKFVKDYFHTYQPQRILDAPVGTGRFLHHYRGAQEVVGVDISEEMLKESSAKLRNLGLATINVEQGDIFNLKFADNSFDLVLCWRFAHLVPAELLTNALHELGRVTAGEVLMQAYVAWPYWRRIIGSLRRLPAKLYQRISGNTPPAPPWMHIRAYFHTERVLATKIHEAGLEMIERSEIGSYGDSTVYAYRLRPLQAAGEQL
jgi:ubiquinone/menaquinone biosynthesis C-methylase UbiE